MFRTGKRWFVVVCSSSLPVVAALLTIYLRTTGESPWWRWQTYLFLGAFVLLAFALSYVNIIKPVRDFEPIVYQVLDFLGDAGIALGEEDGIQPRLNVLITYRPLRRGFWKYLRIVWGLGMEYQPDVNITFPVSKGVAGEVCQVRMPRLVNTEEHGHLGWGFTERDIARFQFQQLTAIYSWPIYEVDKQNRQTGEVIGAVTLDARAPGAFGRIAARRDEYDDFLRFFSGFVSKIAS